MCESHQCRKPGLTYICEKRWQLGAGHVSAGLTDTVHLHSPSSFLDSTLQARVNVAMLLYRPPCFCFSWCICFFGTSSRIWAGKLACKEQQRHAYMRCISSKVVFHPRKDGLYRATVLKTIVRICAFLEVNCFDRRKYVPNTTKSILTDSL
jgi:hypothetical protein